MGDLVHTGSKYTDDERRQAATLYVINGNMSAVSRETGIPKTTLSGWMNSDWWGTVSSEVQSEAEDLFRARCTQIVDKGTLEILDRLENGDYVHTKDGIIRVPMKGKDCAIIAAIFYDKLRLSLDLPTSISKETSAKSMEALMEEFHRLSEGYKDRRPINGECKEIEDE